MQTYICLIVFLFITVQIGLAQSTNASHLQQLTRDNIGQIEVVAHWQDDELLPENVPDDVYRDLRLERFQLSDDLRWAITTTSDYAQVGGIGVTTRLWNMQTQDNVLTVSGGEFSHPYMVFSPDNRLLAVYTPQNAFDRASRMETDTATVALVSLDTLELLFAWSVPQESGVYGGYLQFSPDQRFLKQVRNGDNASLTYVWDTQTDAEIHRLEYCVCAIGFWDVGQLVYAYVDDDVATINIEIFQPDIGFELYGQIQLAEPITYLRFVESRSGLQSILNGVGGDSTIQWDLDTLDFYQPTVLQNAPVNLVHYLVRFVQDSETGEWIAINNRTEDIVGRFSADSVIHRVFELSTTLVIEPDKMHIFDFDGTATINASYPTATAQYIWLDDGNAIGFLTQEAVIFWDLTTQTELYSFAGDFEYDTRLLVQDERLVVIQKDLFTAEIVLLGVLEME